MSERDLCLARAREYPYAIPRGSFTWRGGAVEAFEPAARKGREPVLAIGSNQSPEQLTRKFGERGEIPVQRANLRGFDVFYSAHITGYGAVPAMLQQAPGTTVTLSVTWLDRDQLDAMHASELSAAKYEFATIENIDLALDCGTKLDFARLYVGVSGHLVHDGEAVALDAVRARGRRPTALTTAKVLEIVRHRVSPQDNPDEFILRLVDDRSFRAVCGQALAADAVPFAYPRRKIVR